MTVDLEVVRQALADAKPLYNETMVMSDSLADAIDRLYANAPVWLAACVSQIEKLNDLVLDLKAEQKAGRDEIERLRSLAHIEFVTRRLDELKAWRACADQLAYALMHYFSEPPKPALVVYEKLKGADS